MIKYFSKEKLSTCSFRLEYCIFRCSVKQIIVISKLCSQKISFNWHLLRSNTILDKSVHTNKNTHFINIFTKYDLSTFSSLYLFITHLTLGHVNDVHTNKKHPLYEHFHQTWLSAYLTLEHVNGVVGSTPNPMSFFLAPDKIIVNELYSNYLLERRIHDLTHRRVCHRSTWTRGLAVLASNLSAGPWEIGFFDPWEKSFVGP